MQTSSYNTSYGYIFGVAEFALRFSCLPRYIIFYLTRASFATLFLSSIISYFLSNFKKKFATKAQRHKDLFYIKALSEGVSSQEKKAVIANTLS